MYSLLENEIGIGNQTQIKNQQLTSGLIKYLTFIILAIISVTQKHNKEDLKRSVKLSILINMINHKSAFCRFFFCQARNNSS